MNFRNNGFGLLKTVLLIILLTFTLTFCSKVDKKEHKIVEKKTVQKKEQTEMETGMQKGMLCSDCHKEIENGEFTIPGKKVKKQEESKKKEIN